MASKYDEDWQSSKTTVIQRNEYMFDNELMSDVSFVCGESSHRVFHAHKYVLATSNAEFFSMFYGDLAQEESPIRIKDVDEKSFKEFLHFLYVDDCEVTAGNAIGIMYLAKKYSISSLAKKCSKALEENIETDNVFAVLEQAVYFEEKELEAKCWKIVETKTEECVTSEAFCNITTRTLKSLLEKSKLAIAEVELFKAVLRWVDSECARQGINTEEDKTAKRRILGDIRHEIRFLEMSEQEFAKHVFTSGILTEKEINSIFYKFNGFGAVEFKWPRHKLIRTIAFNRFQPDNVSVNSHYWRSSETIYAALSLSVNKGVFFHGVRLFGNSGEDKQTPFRGNAQCALGAEYRVQFAIKNETVTGTYTSKKDCNVWGYDVILPKPISLLADEEVTMVATIEGPRSHKGTNGKSSLAAGDIVLTFNNSTSRNDGQFYTIFISKR